MKLSIDLDETIADQEFGLSVSEIIRDEIRNAIRAAVRKEIKDFGKAIKIEVSKVAKDALASIRGERIRDVAKRMMETL